MMRVTALELVLCAGLTLSSPSQASAAEPERPQRPNIVIVLTDDQAPWAMGAAVRDMRFRDVPAAHTPNMDRLARDGAVFTNFFCTTPVCSPARAALATGRYASEFGIHDFIPAPHHQLFDPRNEVALDPDASTTFVEVLQASGYRTGLVGKWHLGDWTAPGHKAFHPSNYGFDYFMGLTSGGTEPENPPLEKDGEVHQFSGLTTDILTDHAIEFVRRSRMEPAPFLLCLHTRAPHGPWLPVAPEDWEPYADMDATIPEYPDLDVRKIRKDMREYLASTSGVDRNLGRLLETLDELNLSQNTVVIFTSDHGYNMGHNGIRHKGNGIWATKTRPPGEFHHGTRVISSKYRPNMYDLSLKVPAIVRWPGFVRPGTVIDHTATHLDLFPTLLSIANVPKPDGLILRGRDLSPVLSGNTPDDWDQDVYAEYSMINYVVAIMRCYRTPRYKLIRDFHNEGRDEFYDLEVDPDEARNLIDDSQPDIRAAVDRLDTRILAKMQEVGDPLLEHIEAKEGR